MALMNGLKLPKEFSMRVILLFLSMLSLVFASCTSLPGKTSENDNLVISNIKWRNFIGDLQISEVVVEPILKNVKTGEEYYPVHHDKTFSFLYNIKKGTYLVKSVRFQTGRGYLTIVATDFSNEFEINDPGVYYIGGFNLDDYQLKWVYRNKSKTDTEDDLATLRSILTGAKAKWKDDKVVEIQVFDVENK